MCSKIWDIYSIVFFHFAFLLDFVPCPVIIKEPSGSTYEMVETSPDKTIRYSDIVSKITYRYGLGYRELSKLSPGEKSMIRFIRRFRME